MKKTILLIIFILISSLLISCQKEFNKAFDVFSEIEFQFADNDTFSSITNNFTVTTDSTKYDDAIILWDSSDNYHLNFTESGEYVVIRPSDESIEVELSVFIKVDLDEYHYTYNLKIIVEEADKIDPNEPDNNDTNYFIITYKIDDYETYKRIKYEENKVIKFPKKPIKEGFLFRGWSNKTEIVDEFIIVKNITLFAVFDNLYYETLESDEIDVYNDLDGVYLPLNIFESQPFEFIYFGIRGSTILYELLDEEMNEYVDIDNNYFNIIDGETIIVKVKVIASKNDVSLFKILDLNLGDLKTISILDSKLINDYSYSKIEGVFTGSYYEPKDKMYYFFIEDDTDGIIITTKNQVDLNVGTIIEIIYQKIDSENYLAKIEVKEKIDYDAKVLVNTTKIDEHLLRYSYIEGIVTSNMNNKVFELLLKNKKYEVIIKSNNRKSIIQGMYIGFYGHVIEEEGSYIFIISNSSSIYLEDLDNNEIADIIMRSLGFYSSIITLKNDLNFSDSDPFFNSNITWSSSNELILTNEGIYIKPDDEVEFSLYVTIELLNKSIIKREYIIKALP